MGMPFFIGVLLALSNTFGARMVGLDRDRAFYPVVLAVIASYYVLFAVMAGSIGAMSVETGTMALFLAVVIAGFRKNLWWIVAGLAGHGLLDAFHGDVIANGGVPEWWPAFCASYDLTAAVVLGMLLSVRGSRESLIVAEVSNG
jgi:hypothetical protein